jgi:hypothetical protein
LCPFSRSESPQVCLQPTFLMLMEKSIASSANYDWICVGIFVGTATLKNEKQIYWFGWSHVWKPTCLSVSKGSNFSESIICRILTRLCL